MRISRILIGTAIFLQAYGLHLCSKEFKEVELKQSLDIAESRQREEKLLNYVSVMQYQIDVLTTKDIDKKEAKCPKVISVKK